MSDISNTDSVARIFSLAALNASQTDSSITVAETIGGIQAGTVYPEGTSVTKIISDLLTGSAPSIDVVIYYGATDNIPTNLNGLSSKTVTAKQLTMGKYAQHITAGDKDRKIGQYVVFAVPTNFEVTKWCVPGFEYNIPHSQIINEGYNTYYLNDKSYDVDENPPGIDYLLNVALI